MYIVAKKNGEIAVVSGKYWTGEPSFEVAIGQASIESGILESELLHYHIHDESETADRIFGGWAFSVEIYDDQIVGVDFSPELSKPKLMFTADKRSIVANGVDTSSVEIVAYKENGDVDANYSGTKTVPYKTAIGNVAQKEVVFHAGLGNLTINSTTDGRIIIPVYRDRYDDIRVGNNLTIEAAS